MRMRFLIAALCLLAPALARAQAGGSEKKAAANTLFDEGKKLMDAGETARACAKFEASIAALPQLGTRLNLANCYEKLGRVASAWAEFREVASLAAKIGDRREQFARQRLTQLEPRLPKMVITLSLAVSMPELRVTRDGVVVMPALMDTPVPVDPGKHTVVATAPGYRPSQTEATVEREGQVVRVEIKALEKLPEGAEGLGGAGREGPSDPGRTRRYIGLGVGGAGIVSLGVGLIFGLTAKSKWNDAHDPSLGAAGCDADNLCGTEGFNLVEDAQSAATISTVLVIAGVAATAGGAVLYFTAPKPEVTEPVDTEEESSLRLVPAFGRGFTGVRLKGRF